MKDVLEDMMDNMHTLLILKGNIDFPNNKKKKSEKKGFPKF
jgi:hypothetical protein